MNCTRVKSSPSYVHVCEVKYDQDKTSLKTIGLPESDLFTNYRLNNRNVNRFISIVYSASERSSNLKSNNIHRRHLQFNDLDDVSEMNSEDSNFMQLDEVNEKTWRYPLSEHTKKLPNLNVGKELKKSRTDSLLPSQSVRFNYDPRRFSMYPVDNNHHQQQQALDNAEDNDYYPSELVNNSTFRVSLKSRSKSLFVYNEKNNLNELNDLPSSKETFGRTWTRSHFANTSNNNNNDSNAKPNEKRPSFEYLSLVNGAGNNQSGQTNLQYITQTAIKIVPSEKNLYERRKSKYTIDVNKLPFKSADNEETNKRRVSLKPNQLSDEQLKNQWIGRTVKNTDEHKRKRKAKENKIQFELDKKDFGEINELDLSLSSAESVENLLTLNDEKQEEKPIEQEEKREVKSSEDDIDNEYFKIENQPKSPVEKRTKKNKKNEKEEDEVENDEKESDVQQEESEELTRVDEEVQQIEENNTEPQPTTTQYDFGWLNNRKKKENEKQEDNDYRRKSRVFSVINYDDSDDEPENYQEPEKMSRNYNYINLRPKMRFSIPTESSDNMDEMELPESIEDWLLKWYISKESKNKVYEEAFKAHDSRHKGHLRGADLLDALESTCDLDNLKLDYLFSVLKLCDVDVMRTGANLKVFIILNALAQRIKHLDDTWFMNLLPQMNMSTVENKMFKVKNLWKFLADQKSKTISVNELMIEFAAGGVTGPHIDYAREKLSKKLTFDLLDYISYVPLFVYIHDKIVVNPFNSKHDI